MCFNALAARKEILLKEIDKKMNNQSMLPHHYSLTLVLALPHSSSLVLLFLLTYLCFNLSSQGSVQQMH